MFLLCVHSPQGVNLRNRSARECLELDDVTDHMLPENVVSRVLGSWGTLNPREGKRLV